MNPFQHQFSCVGILNGWFARQASPLAAVKELLCGHQLTEQHALWNSFIGDYFHHQLVLCRQWQELMLWVPAHWAACTVKQGSSYMFVLYLRCVSSKCLHNFWPSMAPLMLSHLLFHLRHKCYLHTKVWSLLLNFWASGQICSGSPRRLEGTCWPCYIISGLC